MFPTRAEVMAFPRTREGPDRTSYPYTKQHQILPHLSPHLYGLDDFSPNMADILAAVNRTGYTLFSVCRSDNIPGLEDAIIRPGEGEAPGIDRGFKVRFEAIPYPNGNEKPPNETKTFHLGCQSVDDTHTDIIITLPGSRSLPELLDQIRLDEHGVPTCGQAAVDQARAFDENERSIAQTQRDPSSFRYSNRAVFMDPEVDNLTDRLQQTYRVIITNAFIVARYFCHMASLSNTGHFADPIGRRHLIGIRGLLPDGKESLIYTGSNVGYDDIRQGVGFAVDEGRNAALRQLLAQDTPWYKNPQFKREPDMFMIVNEFDNLGRVWRHTSEGGSSAANAAYSTEIIATEFYESLTGKDSGREVDFVDKLRYIGANIDHGEILQPFIDLYTRDSGGDGIGPSSVRAGRAHGGRARLKVLNSYTESWSTMFYIDLTKTLISLVAQQPRPFFDFDAMARTRGLVTQDPTTTVGYVPLAVQQELTGKYSGK